MATVKGPQGRMTKPLATRFEVGDVVVRRTSPLDAEYVPPPVDPVAAAKNAEICRAIAFALDLYGVSNKPRPTPCVGDVGVIRKIWISAPNDGDATFLMHDVKWTRIRRIWSAGADEIELKTRPRTAKRKNAAEAWLRRQLATLNVEGV